MIYLAFFSSEQSSAKERAKHGHQLGRGLLAKAIEEEFGISADLSTLRKNDHGKPYFPDLPIHFNISHCKGAVCCVLGKQEVGIDIESAERCALSIISKICSDDEKAEIEQSADPNFRLLQYWTLKEAYVKYLGQGLSYGLKRAAFFWEGKKPILKSEPLPFQHEIIRWGDKSHLISACGQEIPMPIRILES